MSACSKRPASQPASRSVRSCSSVPDAPNSHLPDRKAHQESQSLPPLVGGCLTPRTHYILLSNAGLLSEMIDEDIDNCGFQKFELLDDPCFLGVESIPAQRRNGMHKSFAKGFAEAIKATEMFLEAKEVVTKKSMLQAVQSGRFDDPYVSHFLQKGGDVMWALDAVIGHAEEMCAEARCGLSGDVDESEDQDLLDAIPELKPYVVMWRSANSHQAEFDALPHHPDDFDFNLVRKRLLPDGGKEPLTLMAALRLGRAGS